MKSTPTAAPAASPPVGGAATVSALRHQISELFRPVNYLTAINTIGRSGSEADGLDCVNCLALERLAIDAAEAINIVIKALQKATEELEQEAHHA